VHNATTKQRWAALRRRLGIFAGGPRWARKKRERLAREREAQLGSGQTIPAYLAAAMSSTFGATPSPAFASASLTPFPSHAAVPAASPEGDTVAATAPGSSSMSTSTGPGASAHDDTRSLDLTKQDDPAALWDRPSTPSGAGAPPRRRFAGAIAAAAVLLLVAGAFVLLRRSRPADGAPADAAPAAPIAAAPQVTPSDATAAPAAPERPAALAGAQDVVVARGDTLWHLAGQHLGDPFLWPRVHQANHALVRDPDLIFPGQRLHMPPAPTRPN